MRTVPATIRQAIAVLSLVTYLPSCTGWHTLAATRPLPHPEREQALRVTLQDGTRFELRKARIRGDSLVGESTSSSKPVRTALALQQIKRIEDLRVDTGLTVLGIATVLGLALVAAVVAINESLSYWSRPTR